jgi:hypothetical protein
VLAPQAYDYRVYGLTLRANRRLPHLPRTGPADRQSAVEVRFGVGEETGELVRLTYGDSRAALQFAIHPAGHRVWVNWTGDARATSISNATAMLVGPVLGRLLRLRRTVSLHGCVVKIGTRAVVLVAGKGVGKSTVAAAMAQRGHAVLSDDLAAIPERATGGWMAEPGYPRLRLGPASIAAIDTWAASAPARVPDAGAVLTGLDKRYLALSSGDDRDEWRFHPEPLPAGVIYELRRDLDLLAPVVSPVSGAERAMTLLRHATAPTAPLGASTRADEFARLGRLAADIPIRRLACPDSLKALPDVCQMLVDDATSNNYEAEA